MANDNNVTARFVLGLAIVGGVYMFWKMFIYKESLDTKIEKLKYANTTTTTTVETPTTHTPTQEIPPETNTTQSDAPAPEKPPAIARLEQTADELKQDPEHQRVASARMSLGGQQNKINEVLANAGSVDMSEGNEDDW